MCIRIFSVVPIISAAALFGCESVNSRHIVGERESADLSAQLNGTWILEDSAVVFQQVSPGELRAAGVEWNDNTQEFQKVELHLILSRLDEATYFNLRRDDEHNPLEQGDVDGTWHQPMLYELGEDTLTVRGVSVDAFAEAVDAGTLKGRVEIKRDENGQQRERHVWIEGDKAAFDEFIRAADLEELFDGEPATLRRLTDDDE